MSILGGGALSELEARSRLEERQERIASGNWGFRHDNRIVRAIWAPATVIAVLLGVATGEIIVSPRGGRRCWSPDGPPGPGLDTP